MTLGGTGLSAKEGATSSAKAKAAKASAKAALFMVNCITARLGYQ